MSDLALKLIAENKAAHARGDESAKKLDIGNCGLTELPEELFDCVWLEELIASNKWWDDAQGKTVYSQNQYSKNNIKSLSLQVHRLKKLKILQLSGELRGYWNIEGVSALSGLTSLQTLDLSYN